MCDSNGVLYCNDGDWVESQTALVEHFDGTLELLRWAADQTTKNTQVSNKTSTAQACEVGASSSVNVPRAA